MSRESVVWSDNTRNYLQNIITNAAKEAQDLVNDQLKEKDFLEWIRKAVAIKSGSNSDWTLSNIAKITDVTDIHPVYHPNPKIKLTAITEFWCGFSIRNTQIKSEYRRNTGNIQFIDRKSINSWNDIVGYGNRIYKFTDRQNPRKDEYILRQGSNQFTSIKKLNKDEMFKLLFENDFEHPRTSFCKNEKDFDRLQEVSEAVWEILNKHKLVLDYDEVDVPESFKSQLKTNEEIEAEEKEAAKETDPYAGLTPAERRKLTDSLVLQHVKLNKTSYDVVNASKPLSYTKKEVLASDFITDNGTVYYANGVEEEGLTTLASVISHPYTIPFDKPHRHNFDDSVFNVGLKIIRVPANMPKKFTKNHKHINEFFGFKELYTEKDTVIKMNERLIKWNTLRLINQDFAKFKFLSKFGKFNPEIAKIYTEVATEMNTFTDVFHEKWKAVATIPKDVYSGFESYLQKVTDFALFKADNPHDDEGLKAKSLELFGVESLNDVQSIDFELYNKYCALKEYSSQIHALFNFVDFDHLPQDGDQVVYKLLEAYGLNAFNLSDFNIETEKGADFDSGEVALIEEKVEVQDAF